MQLHTERTTLGSCGFCWEGPPLQLILQHACANSHSADMCNLMLVSKATYKAVLEFCKGSLQVRLVEVADVLAVQPFAAWLAKNGQLLGSVEFGTALERFEGTTEQERSAVEQTLASALQQAAADSKTNTSSLQLRSCTLYAAGADIGAVLQQLPVATMTSLNLGIVQPYSNEAAHSDYLSPLQNSIIHLTDLRCLDLQFSAGDRATLIGLDPVLQQLSALVQLTSLSVSKVNDEEALQFLPASIKALSFSWSYEGDDTQLRLGHLTALTRLSGRRLIIPEQSTLPTSLIVLELTDVHDGACLMPLQKLREMKLDMHDGDSDATYPQLSALSSLSHVELSYNKHRPGRTAGVAWHALPLRYLRASNLWPQDLAGLTQLTYLTLNPWGPNCTTTDVAEALQTLTNLQVLTLGPGDFEAMFPGWRRHLKEQAVVIYKALCSLKRLSRLCLDGVHVSHEAAELLASSIASQLVHLQILACELDNNNLGTILSNSKHLRSLDVRYNDKVDNEILPIVAQLRKLKHMYFDITCISMRAFESTVPKVSYGVSRL